MYKNDSSYLGQMVNSLFGIIYKNDSKEVFINMEESVSNVETYVKVTLNDETVSIYFVKLLSKYT